MCVHELNGDHAVVEDDRLRLRHRMINRCEDLQSRPV